MKAFLVLEDGKVFTGKSFGVSGTAFGEVVFNTNMTGYQEVLTDPSYCGQIVTMTYPLIGNYGVNHEDMESSRSWVKGFVIKDLCEFPSSWRKENSLDEFLKEQNIIGLYDIDTRALTKWLRGHGTMRGVITTEEKQIQKWQAEIAAQPSLIGKDMVSQVTTSEQYILEGKKYKVVLLDFGAKNNIMRWLNKLGCEVIVVPAQTTAEEILKMKPDGIMLSNGPGDPKGVLYAVETIKKMLGKCPIFGICLGHQLLSLALGANTYKLPFGHRGGNHPVKDLKTGRVYITSQNHGFAVDPASLQEELVEITHLNLNDNTIEGIKCKKVPAFSVQYHPEAFPGPKDSEYLFFEFISLMEAYK